MTDPEQPPDKGRSWLDRAARSLADFLTRPFIAGAIALALILLILSVLSDGTDTELDDASCDAQYGYWIDGAQSEEERIVWENAYISCLDDE